MENDLITMTRFEYEELFRKSFSFELLREAVKSQGHSIALSVIRIYLGLNDVPIPGDPQEKWNLKTENSNNFFPVVPLEYEELVRDRHTVELLRETVMRGRAVTLPMLKIFLGIQDDTGEEYPEGEF